MIAASLQLEVHQHWVVVKEEGADDLATHAAGQRRGKRARAIRRDGSLLFRWRRDVTRANPARQ